MAASQALHNWSAAVGSGWLLSVVTGAPLCNGVEQVLWRQTDLIGLFNAVFGWQIFA
jgi:hypothetical protein